MTSKKRSSRSQLPLLPSRHSSASFTLNLHHRHTDRQSRMRRRRKSSCHALCFLLWDCAVLCLPKPPPHHTPNLTTIEFAGAVCGAWKQTGAAVSHDPKETGMSNAWYEVLSVLHLMAMLSLSQANLLLLPRTFADGYQP
ncbi:hypothetical protein CFP56_027922 [Quercus suber]|uniref:Uncharacterized protein n=1 Tax=Quercus suber TaxID=58331 RepID=A0AAW0JX94_QUESU